MSHPDTSVEPSGTYRYYRVAASLLLMMLGNSGMYAAVVTLYPISVEFGISRGDASLPYLCFMVGFGMGGVVIGRLSDRIGIFFPVVGSAMCLSAALYLGSAAQDLFLIAITIGFMSGFLGSATTFGPLVADISHWFIRRRGTAVGIVISGNYVAGTIWPPIMQHFIDTQGWRATLVDLSMFVVLAMLPLALVLIPRSPKSAADEPQPQNKPTGTASGAPQRGLSLLQLQCLICCAGIGCCAAMAMPQVHMVAYAIDLGFDAARGAEMLSVMLGFGVISRLGSGWISDRIGGLRTLMLGSLLQMLALALFLTGDSMVALYVFAALFGLSQGGIVPSYTIIVREYFPARQAGWRIGLSLLATMLGMALGGWFAGLIYDWTGSYTLAFVNAVAFNAGNLAIAVYLFKRLKSPGEGFMKMRLKGA